jgi:pimeloyl-ACP methyl ester carboxylesterase
LVTETAWRFGRGDHLVGIAAQPTETTSDRPAVILINAGMIYRIGPDRLHVRMARELARNGHLCLRFDLSGMGDSSSTGSGSNATRWVDDVRDSMTFMSERFGCRRFVLFGICAGAVRAYDTTLADQRVSGLFLLDCHLYPTWKTPLIYYSRKILSVSNWINAIRYRFVRLRSGGSGDAPDLLGADILESGGISKQSYGEGLRSLDQRKTWVSQIISGAFPKIYNYSAQFTDGFSYWKYTSRISADYFPDASHTFASRQRQDQLIGFVVGKIRQHETDRK